MKALGEYTVGVHLWGKRLSNIEIKVSHYGNLNSCFGNNSIK